MIPKPGYIITYIDSKHSEEEYSGKVLCVNRLTRKCLVLSGGNSKSEKLFGYKCNKNYMNMKGFDCIPDLYSYSGKDVCWIYFELIVEIDPYEE
ncbi:MAG: hypothetical protein ACOYLO_00280 [Ferruginibacter sp.]